MIKLHPTIDEDQKNLSVHEFINGTVKSNSKEQYGYGLEAIRLWVARSDEYVGDR